MIDTLLAILQNLEPVLLVIATAWATVTATGINERRKRRYELEDRRSEERRQQHGQKRALLLQVLDHRSEYVRAQSHAPEHLRKELVDASAHSMLNTAAATGDAEVIKAVDYFLSDLFDDEGELLDLVSRRVAALESPSKKRRWWQSSRRALGA